jgi:hypothetical protein
LANCSGVSGWASGSDSGAATTPSSLIPLSATKLRVEFFQSVQVFEGCDGVHEIHAVLAKVFRGFAIVPFV